MNTPPALPCLTSPRLTQPGHTQPRLSTPAFHASSALSTLTITLAITCGVWQGIETCQDEHGYVSHESQWQGRVTGSDNRGNDWSTFRWHDQTITEERQR
jgi:hypothetical protein